MLASYRGLHTVLPHTHQHVRNKVHVRFKDGDIYHCYLQARIQMVRVLAQSMLQNGRGSEVEKHRSRTKQIETQYNVYFEYLGGG